MSDFVEEDLEAELYLDHDRLSYLLTQQGIREGQLHMTQTVQIVSSELDNDILHLDLLIKNPRLH